MANDATQVRVAGTGTVYTGTTAAVEPTDITTTWDATWSDHGLCTPDGVTLTPTFEAVDIPAWQLGSPARSVVTARVWVAKFQLIQNSGRNFRLAVGGGTWTGSGGKFKFTPPQAGTVDQRKLGLEFVDGSVKKRLIAPLANVTALGDVPWRNNTAIVLDVTMKILGDNWYVQSNDTADDPATP